MPDPLRPDLPIGHHHQHGADDAHGGPAQPRVEQLDEAVGVLLQRAESHQQGEQAGDGGNTDRDRHHHRFDHVVDVVDHVRDKDVALAVDLERHQEQHHADQRRDQETQQLCGAVLT
ncbi:hypothetical protein D9M72_601680 [compost metagenome]